MSGDDQQNSRAERNSKKKKNERDNGKVVRITNQIAQQNAQHEDGARQPALPHKIGRLNEARAAVVHDAGDQCPTDETDAQERQIGCRVLIEQHGINGTDRPDGDARVYGQPELTDQRPPIALAHVVAGEHAPDSPAFDPPDEVLARSDEKARPGARGGTG